MIAFWRGDGSRKPERVRVQATKRRRCVHRRRCQAEELSSSVDGAHVEESGVSVRVKGSCEKRDGAVRKDNRLGAKR